MKAVFFFRGWVALLLGLTTLTTQRGFGVSAQVLSWNNLGMHCMDSDYSVFSILPPYNTIEAQLIVAGGLVTASNGYSISYQAIADPDGSINRTSVGKGNWSQYALSLYGADLAPDTGLLGWQMPGTNNVSQAMLFETMNAPASGVSTPVNWWRAEGIPITPYDDAGQKNPYPLMRLIARNSSGAAIATNDIVLPVSDEMDCRACHASGTEAAAQPAAGWVWSDNPERDYRLNILRRHDESQFAQHHDVYVSALAARGFNSQGLYRGVVADNHPVLCATCHASEALGTGSYSNIPPLTASVHSKHAGVKDPELLLTLDNSANRAACYRCHPGSTTKCLRGAMGGAIAADGSLEMQCQSCHGNMSAVGSSSRIGWFMEPNCQSCHTGTATSNNGQIRYSSCFETNGAVRVAVNQTFATQPNTPATGISLYRFSAGHGGLQCSACHGSTHAEFPATHRNDNLRNEKIQGHAGVMVECTSCHTSMSVNSTTARGGPHGMHPVGSSWVSGHHDYIGGVANCQVCHGVDYRGTPLSRAQASRTINVSFDGTSVNFPVYRGAEIGCYNCHNGPSNDHANTSANPVVTSFTTNTLNDTVLAFDLPVTGAGAVARVISQPAHGSVGVSNNVATYFPEPGFVGTDEFTFAAYNGSKNSLLATGTVAVAQGTFSLVAQALVPPSYPATWAAPFTVVATPVNVATAPTFDWDFGDGSAHEASRNPTHAYAAAGHYNWRVTASLQQGSTTVTTNIIGTISISEPVELASSAAGGVIQLSWPISSADGLLEESSELGPDAHWTVAPEVAIQSGGTSSITVSNTGNSFYRLRKL
jgi:PKD repeat protein